MAADRVGAPGEGSNAYWNNSYMAVVGKVEYNWDAANGKVSDAGDKISMKLGIGAQEKIGVTYENLDALNANDSATLKVIIRPVCGHWRHPAHRVVPVLII